MKFIQLFILISIVNAQNIFFYSKSTKKDLNIVEDEYIVKIVNDYRIKGSNDFKNYYNVSLNTKKIIDIKKNIFRIKTDASNRYSVLSNLKQYDNIAINPLYTTSYNDTLGVYDELIVKLKPGYKIEDIKDINKKYNITIIKNTKLYTILRIPPKDDPIQIANSFYDSGFFEYAQPSFLIQPVTHKYFPNDEWFNYQITCENIGQTINDGHSGTYDADIDAPEAWDITKGNSNIVIAVIDEGVTSNHPDLPNTRQVRLDSSNFAAQYDSTDVNDPSPSGDGNHGNACAGVIAATMDNNEGIAGIAPNCKIMSIRLPIGPGFSGSSDIDIADAIIFAVDNGANILSNSWGYNSQDPVLSVPIVDAIQYAIDSNKVVLFSIGNTADHQIGPEFDGYIAFPANADIDGLISVGATDRNDKQSIYSGTSNPLSENNQIVDICAPSHKAYPWQITGETWEMWSLDIPLLDGYNTWKITSTPQHPLVGEKLPASGVNPLSYTGRFGGTSHSAPVVAGIAALVLSINSTFSPLEVFNIITGSADKVGGYTYSNGWSEELGFGRANAFQAVMTACPDNYEINWIINSAENLEYQAGDFINASNIIESNSNEIEIHASNYIKLLPGFHAESGSNVIISIAPCQVVN